MRPKYSNESHFEGRTTTPYTVLGEVMAIFLMISMPTAVCSTFMEVTGFPAPLAISGIFAEKATLGLNECANLLFD